MAQVNGELVTWRKVMTLMATCIAVPVGISWALITHHENRPAHMTSVTKETFALYREAETSRDLSLQRQFDKISQELTELRTLILQQRRP